MDTVKLSNSKTSQTIKLPKKYRFSKKDVYIKKLGEVVYLFPKTSLWKVFMDGLDSFSDDFMSSQRPQRTQQKRKKL